MSRIIVKQLPKRITEAKVRSIFGQYGMITDCSLKYKNGVFRQFAFIGFADDSSAGEAVKALNHTYIETSKISVEHAKDFTEAAVKGGNSAKKASKASRPNVSNKQKLKSSDKIIGKLKNDEQFKEFLSLHKLDAGKNTWHDDSLENGAKDADVIDSVSTQDSALKDVKDANLVDPLEYAFEGESESSDEDESNKLDAKDTPGSEKGAATCGALTDLDFLEQKKNSKRFTDSDDGAETDTSAGKSKSPDGTNEVCAQHPDRPDLDTGSSQLGPFQKPDLAPNSRAAEKTAFVVKVKNLGPKVRPSMLKDFFLGLKTTFVRIPKNDKNLAIGVAFVGFSTEKDMELAMRRSRTIVDKRKLVVTKVSDKDVETKIEMEPKPRPWEFKTDKTDTEPIAESGRLFVRNLAHTCQEEDLEHLFNKFGSLTEVNLPIDKTTKRMKGFAHITFMMPEHAVLAYNALDGTSFQGRILHVLPGRPRKDEASESTDYKKTKEQEKKKQASSSHNWNTLFLGPNAIAEVMSQKYGVDKSQLLDAQASQSLGVRLALGETEIVSETRKFLLQQGVCLDAFSQASAPRSKNVIIAKNLPFGVKASQLEELFSRFGALGRLVLPPSGVTALIEFVEQYEAKEAFTKLAYTRFQHVPLYLEWAPMGSLKSLDAPATGGEETEPNDSNDLEPGSDQSSDREEVPRVGCTLFVKNVNFTTREDMLKKHFSACGTVVNAVIAKKRDAERPGKALSMGYGFVKFEQPSMALEALKVLQNSELEGHKLDLKLSERTNPAPSGKASKSVDKTKKQRSTKILVRNIPFQANKSELVELFKVFGDLKMVRLPKKVGGHHRGFAFVDFLTKNDAKRAFNALCHSTHLYGRRLVLEWADEGETIEMLQKKTADQYVGGSVKKLKRAELEDVCSSE